MKKRFSLVALPLAACVALQAAAYDHPLLSNDVRDAYFLGTDRARAGAFLARYMKALPAFKMGPYVSQVELRTPFAQVVAGSREHTLGYSAQQAAQDYKKAGDTVQVRVQILFGISDSPILLPPPPCQGVRRMNAALECFHDFRFTFSQGKSLRPGNIYGTPIYGIGDSTSLLGGNLWFSFPADEVDSEPLRVSVIGPQGRQFSTSLDLAALR